MKNKSIINPFKTFIEIFASYNLIIFIVTVIGGLIIAVLSLASILDLPYSSSYTSPQNNTVTFEQTTINQLDQLKTSDNSGVVTLPSGRINPFFE